MRKLTILLLLGFLAMGSCNPPEPVHLRVRVGGCSLLWDHAPRLLCAANVRDSLHLILVVEGPPLARLTVRIGEAASTQVSLSPSGHATIDQPFPKVAARITLHAASPEGSAEYTLDVQPRMPFPKAYARRSAIDCSHSAQRCRESVRETLDRLETHPGELDAPEHAFLLGALAKQLVEKAKTADPEEEGQALRRLAIPVFIQAMAEARTTGLLSVEAWALDRLGQALRDQGASVDLHETAAELSNPVHRRALDQCPEAGANVLYWRSLVAEDLGDLPASKHYASEAAALAEQFSEKKSFQISTRLQRALAAQSLQETQEAQLLTRQTERQLADGFLSDACEVTEHYNSIAWIQLVARQTGHSGEDPEAAFQKAQEFLARCQDPRAAREHQAVLATNRALFAVSRAEAAAPPSAERLLQLDQAVAFGQEALHRQVGVRSVTRQHIKLDLADLSARIALLRGQGADALQAFAQLERLTSTELFTPYYRWASRVGQADAYVLLGQSAEALTSYAQAEALLDRMADELPITTRRQLFLTQFEAGTGRYLKLLLEIPDSQNKVLRVIRHARVRALRIYTRGLAKASVQTAELLKSYWRLLSDRESAEGELRAAPLAEQAAVQGRLVGLKRAQEALLEQLYRGDPTANVQAERLPAAAGELIIVCYPLPADPGSTPGQWICAGATASAVHIVRIAAPQEADAAPFTNDLLAALREPLRTTRHLRILPYGPLRAVPWASLSLDGQRLEERFTISYGLDLPAMGETAPGFSRGALLVTNPQQDLTGAQHAGELLGRELPAAGWQLDARAGAPRRGGHLFTLLREKLRWPKIPPALAKEVIAGLPAAALFIYYGHAESSGPGGWDSHLLFADGGSISARDIMALPVVPLKVLLIGCETAVSDRDAPADEAGLAQAFVLRGSDAVLATTRKVADATAAALVDKLVQLGALRPGGPPLAAALREAIVTLRSQHPAADLEAFRVYTP